MQAQSTNPPHLHITPDFPNISDVESGALTTALAGKNPSLSIKGSGTVVGSGIQELEFMNSHFSEFAG